MGPGTFTTWLHLAAEYKIALECFMNAVPPQTCQHFHAQTGAARLAAAG